MISGIENKRFRHIGVLNQTDFFSVPENFAGDPRSVDFQQMETGCMNFPGIERISAFSAKRFNKVKTSGNSHDMVGLKRLFRTIFPRK